MDRRVVVILVVGLLLRLGWGLSRGADLGALPDQGEYLALGRSLLAGDGLSFVDARYPVAQYAFRAPGYPAFVAACLGSVTGVRAVQALIDTGTVLGVYLLARRVTPGYAWVGAALAAGCPYLIYFSGLVLTETLFTGLVVWGAVMLLSERRGMFLGGCVVLALGVLVRPGAVGLPVAMAGVAAMARAGVPRFPAALVAGAVTAAVLFPWAYRNQRLLGEWVWTTTNAGVTSYDGFNPAADGSSDQGEFLPHMPELGEMTETQRNAYLGRLAADWRAEHPGEAARLGVVKAVRTWSPVPLSEAYRGGATAAAGAAYSAVAWVLAGVGLFRARGQIGVRVLMLVPAVYLTMGAVVTVGSLRYRVPAEPFLAVLAAVGAGVVADGGRRRAGGRAGSAHMGSFPVSVSEDRIR